MLVWRVWRSECVSVEQHIATMLESCRHKFGQDCGVGGEHGWEAIQQLWDEVYVHGDAQGNIDPTKRWIAGSVSVDSFGGKFRDVRERTVPIWRSGHCQRQFGIIDCDHLRYWTCAARKLHGGSELEWRRLHR